MEKGNFESLLSSLNPQYYPATNYHSRGGGGDDERKRGKGGQLFLNMLSIKSTRLAGVWVGVVVGVWGEQG